MIKFVSVALAGALLLPVAATAQTAPDSAPVDQSATDMPAPAPAPVDATTGPTAPDGTRAFGIEPYIGIQGGYERFDSGRSGGLVGNCDPRNGCPHGAIAEAVAGVNIPLGPLFVGAEGSIAKGFDQIDWEYAAYGRVGFRAGSSGLIYGKAGYEWIHTDGYGRADDFSYGLGVEVGPKDIGLGGLTNNAGVRLRFEATTYNTKSVRPVAGVIFHF